MKKESILVVEDEPLVALEIKEDLEGFGYVVPEIVNSGEDVLDAARRVTPALVLMDVRIGGKIDGIDAASLLKAEFDLPVIFLTAYSDTVTLGRAAATGPDAYLLKPFDQRELAANIALALAKSRAGPAARAGLRDSMALLDALGQAAILADLANVIVHANEAAMGLLGFEGEARLAGMPLARFIDGVQRTERLVPGAGELGIRGADGRLIAEYGRLEDLLHEDGTRIGSLLTFESMSPDERRHLERSADTVNRDLESLVPAHDSAGPGFEAGGFLLPCSSGSGDIVEAFGLDGLRAVFYGLDVAGHGGLASLVAFSIHTMIRDLAGEPRDGGAHSASTLVKKLNERYTGGAGTRPFFTMTLGVADSGTGEFLLVRAGHPPALLIPHDGACRELRPKGRALGLGGDPAVEEIGGFLGAGDRLLLVSDGFLEAAFGLESGADLGGLIACLEELRALPIGDLAASLRALVLDRHSRAALRDDASLLLIGRPLQAL